MKTEGGGSRPLLVHAMDFGGRAVLTDARHSQTSGAFSITTDPVLCFMVVHGHGYCHAKQSSRGDLYERAWPVPRFTVVGIFPHQPALKVKAARPRAHFTVCPCLYPATFPLPFRYASLSDSFHLSHTQNHRHFAQTDRNYHK